ncbi:MmpS family transport accessory protein, partial [Mycobacterium kansasii]
NAPLPFKRTITVGADVTMLQVVATGKQSNPGCRITLDGKVVAEKPVGGDAHCIYTR